MTGRQSRKGGAALPPHTSRRGLHAAIQMSAARARIGAYDTLVHPCDTNLAGHVTLGESCRRWGCGLECGNDLRRSAPILSSPSRFMRYKTSPDAQRGGALPV